MAIVHLNKRVTNNTDEYNRYLRSSDSLIFVKTIGPQMKVDQIACH